MKQILATLFMLLGALAVNAAPLRTGFNYEGRLSDGADLANGSFDFRFALFDDAVAGNVAAGPYTNASVRVTNGLFQVVMDFGAAVFDGTQYWLEIGVRPSGESAIGFTTLAPRNLILPTPYALHALTAAGVVDGAIGASALAASSISADKIAPRQVVKSLNGLGDDVEFAVEGDLVLRTDQKRLVLAAVPSCFTYTNCYWSLFGNGNIVPDVNFLGTVAGELAPLEFRVNNNRSFLHVFTAAASAPNLIGGFVGNTVGGVGGSISGGGSAGLVQTVLSDYGSIAGGRGNRILPQSPHATIGAGLGHFIDVDTPYATIAGGHTNLVLAASGATTIAGGQSNIVQSFSSATTIAGGRMNNVASRSPLATIGGGDRNAIGQRSTNSVVVGGAENGIGDNAFSGAIGGGEGNSVQFDTRHATVGGGARNVVGANTHGAAIGGGEQNVIVSQAHAATVAGGATNAIAFGANHGFIGGGLRNDVQSPLSTIAGGGDNLIGPSSVGVTIAGGSVNQVIAVADYGTIGGGNANLIQRNVTAATIGGGQKNTIEGFAHHGAIGGGEGNTVRGGADHGVIGGGISNTIATNSPASVVSGGRLNTIGLAAPTSTIGGGDRNSIGQRSTNSVIAGGGLNAIGTNAPDSVIGGGGNNRISNFATNATIGGGRGNFIHPSAPHAVIPGGDRAVATNYNQYVFASGSFAQAGDAQHSQYVLRNRSVGNVPVELFLDGAAREIVLWPGSVLTFDILVVAGNAAGDGAGYQIQGVIKYVGGAITFVGIPTITTLGENVAGWNVSVQADAVDNALILVVTGSGVGPVSWVAHVRTVEVRM